MAFCFHLFVCLVLFLRLTYLKIMLDSGGNVKWYSTMENISAVPKKLAPRY